MSSIVVALITHVILLLSWLGETVSNLWRTRILSPNSACLHCGKCQNPSEEMGSPVPTRCLNKHSNPWQKLDSTRMLHLNHRSLVEKQPTPMAMTPYDQIIIHRRHMGQSVARTEKRETSSETPSLLHRLLGESVLFAEWAMHPTMGRPLGGRVL